MHKIYKNAFIYKISFPNSKIYIGRWTGTYNKLLCRYANSKNKRYVEKAILKYGFDNCIFEIIEQFQNISNQELNEREICWITNFDSTNNLIGYNLSQGGNVSVLEISSKDSISKKAKERLKNKQNHPSFGLKRSKISCEKISKSLKGKYCKHKNSQWKGYLEKEELTNLIISGCTFLSISQKMNTSQKIIERSLEFHFGTKSLRKIREKFNYLSLEQITELISKGGTIRSLSKLGFSQSYIQKNLIYHFGTKSISEVKYLLGLDKCFWQKFNILAFKKILTTMKIDFTILNFEEITSWNVPLKLKCKEGHTFYCYLSNLKKQNHCGACKKIAILDKKIEELKKTMLGEHYNLISVSNFLGKKNTQIEYICPKGHKRKILWSAWVSGSRCALCSLQNAQKKAKENYQKKIKNILEILEAEMLTENYKLLPGQKYINNRTKLAYICPVGHERKLTLQSWRNGNRCMKCRNNKNKD
jgi:group I intron endonuclease